MQVIVRAGSPGQAIAAAQSYREWLLQHQLWSTQTTPLEILEVGSASQRAERSAHEA